MFTVNHIYDEKFRYHEYPRLIMLLDSRQNDIEVWNHNKGQWKPLDAVGGCKSVDDVFTGQFLILRRADHPTGMYMIPRLFQLSVALDILIF